MRAPAGTRRWAAGAALAAALVLVPGPVPLQAQISVPDSLVYVEGDPEAPIVVTEFLDFGCSACALFSKSTLPVLRREYIETGRVVWRMVPFVLGPFPNAEAAARAAWCASREGRFRAYHDALYAQRHRWARERDPEAALVQLAGAVGLAEEPFRACYRSDDAEDRVKRQNEVARKARVRGTPAFDVHGRPVLGALDPRAFRAILDELLRGGGP